MSQGQKPREWWIEINETFDDDEQCQSGLVYSAKMLDEILGITSHGMIHVIEHSAYAALSRECEELRNALREFDNDDNWSLESQYIDRKTKTGNTDFVYVGKWDPRVFASHAIKGECLGLTPENERRKPSEFYNPDKQQTIAFQLKQNQIDELKRKLEIAKDTHDSLFKSFDRDFKELRAELAKANAYIEHQASRYRVLYRGEFTPNDRTQFDALKAEAAEWKAKFEEYDSTFKKRTKIFLKSCQESVKAELDAYREALERIDKQKITSIDKPYLLIQIEGFQKCAREVLAKWREK